MATFIPLKGIAHNVELALGTSSGRHLARFDWSIHDPLCARPRGGFSRPRSRDLVGKPRPRHLARRRLACSMSAGDGEAAAAGDSGQGSRTRLGTTLRRKQRVLQARLDEMAPGELAARLEPGRQVAKPHALLDLIAMRAGEGHTCILVEAARERPSESPQALAARCRQYVAWGADAVAVCTDEELTPEGFADLQAVCREVPVPVLRKDWILHPLQIAETMEAGAAAIHLVHAVLGKGTAMTLSYAAHLGLDAIVEVVNAQEAREVEPLELPLYGFNISVGLSVALPFIRTDIAKALAGDLPFGAASIAGIESVEQGRAMKVAQVDAVYLKKEALQGLGGQAGGRMDPEMLLRDLRYAMTGDD